MQFVERVGSGCVFNAQSLVEEGTCDAMCQIGCAPLFFGTSTPDAAFKCVDIGGGIATPKIFEK